MNPIIGWRNIGFTASSWASTEARLAFNGLTYDGWSGFSTGVQSFGFSGPNESANYFAIANHNLSGSTVRLFAGGSQVASKFVTSNSPFLVKFPSQTSSSWSIQTNLATDIAFVKVCYVGRYLELERGIWVGHSPMRYNRANVYINNLSDSGQLLGRKLIKEGANGQISVDNISSDWVRTDWEPFREWSERRGFFFQHNPDQYPDEVSFCWSTGNAQMSNSRVGGPNQKGYVDLSIPVRALV